MISAYLIIIERIAQMEQDLAEIRKIKNLFDNIELEHIDPNNDVISLISQAFDLSLCQSKKDVKIILATIKETIKRLESEP